jgi:NAD(P)-dependent dehydrogenase (short-subunit alcohol dehydrogenase family)
VVDYDFSGKVALVTGAASGIGYATAARLIREGAFVAMVDINEMPLSEAVASLESTGRVLGIQCDITSAAAVDFMVSELVDQFERLDFAFNNAGVAGIHRRVDQFSEEDYSLIMDTNVKGTWLCMRSEIAVMLKQGSGSIVNTSSAIGLTGGPSQSIYSASKHAIIGLTKSAALDLGKSGIRVNCVCPGVIATPLVQQAVERDNPAILEIWKGLHPMGRIGTPDEVASMVSWLFSDDAAFVHGSAMSIDGGYVAP